MWWLFLLGLFVGGVIGVLYGLRWKFVLRSREEQLVEVTEQLQEAKNLEEKNRELSIELEKLKVEKAAQDEKLRWTENAQQHLREAFEALASEVLKSNADEFLKRAKEQLDTVIARVRGDWGVQKEELKGLIRPLEEALEKMDEQVRALEQKREGAYQGLTEQLRQLASAQESLQTTTVRLVQALRSPTARGRWGEFQLRRIVELAGMTAHVDFEEQAATAEGRPDMIIYMPNEGVLPVDSKAPPLDAFFSAVEAEDEAARRRHLEALLKSMRQEFVIMYVPSEACLSTVFQLDPEIFEFAARQRVLITSPVTLLALLRAVAYGWQQHEIAESAREVTKQALELYHRFVKFLEHFQKAGAQLDKAIDAYNRAVGSVTSRVFPAARRLEELTEKELPELTVIDRKPRSLPVSESSTETAGVSMEVVTLTNSLPASLYVWVWPLKDLDKRWPLLQRSLVGCLTCNPSLAMGNHDVKGASVGGSIAGPSQVD